MTHRSVVWSLPAATVTAVGVALWAGAVAVAGVMWCAALAEVLTGRGPKELIGVAAGTDTVGAVTTGNGTRSLIADWRSA